LKYIRKGLIHKDHTYSLFSKAKILIVLKGKKEIPGWVLVARGCNPSYSGGRDQKDHSSKPALGK
jgi:hypothetical protein